MKLAYAFKTALCGCIKRWVTESKKKKQPEKSKKLVGKIYLKFKHALMFVQRI